MSNAYIHYVRRKIVTNYPNDIEDPWYSELQAYDSGFGKPSFHVTRLMSWPTSEIAKGDIIWLVGQLSSPWGKLPPSLDARIVVEYKTIEVAADSMKKARFIAGAGSKWLPLWDMSELLKRLCTISRHNERKTLINPQVSNVGQAFQGIKKIAEPSLIDEFVTRIETQLFQFISYRVADGTRMAFDWAQSLMLRGQVVFWDRWSLPRRLAERRELVSDAALDGVLSAKIAESSVVWGIESALYNEVNSYSAKEKKLALTLGKYRSAYEVKSQQSHTSKGKPLPAFAAPDASR